MTLVVSGHSQRSLRCSGDSGCWFSETTGSFNEYERMERTWCVGQKVSPPYTYTPMRCTHSTPGTLHRLDGDIRWQCSCRACPCLGGIGPVWCNDVVLSVGLWDYLAPELFEARWVTAVLDTPMKNSVKVDSVLVLPGSRWDEVMHSLSVGHPDQCRHEIATRHKNYSALTRRWPPSNELINKWRTFVPGKTDASCSSSYSWVPGHDKQSHVGLSARSAMPGTRVFRGGPLM